MPVINFEDPKKPVEEHEAKADPHPQYLTQPEADALYDGTGSVAAHEAASDPHTQYLTQARGDVRYSQVGHNHAGVYDPAGTAALAVSGHVAASDPHGDRGYAASQMSAHVAAFDPHPSYLTEAEAELLYSPLGHTHSGTYEPLGTAASTMATHLAATDPHGDRAYALGLVDDLSGVSDPTTARGNLGLGNAATKNTGTTAGTVAAGDDSRLSNARTPTAHASSHAAGGSDPITIASSQISDLASLLKQSGPPSGGGSGRFIMPMDWLPSAGKSTITPGAASGFNTSRIWYVGCYLPPGSYDAIAIQVAAWPSGARAIAGGLYAMDGANGFPGTLLASGTATVNAAATFVMTFSSTLVWAGGYLYRAVLFPQSAGDWSAGQTIRWITGPAGVGWPFPSAPSSDPFSNTNTNFGWTVPYTAGSTLPSTAPLATISASASGPDMRLRIA